MGETATASRSDRVHGWAAGLARGPAEVLDFLLPLWAGAALGLSPSAIGTLVAAETLVSFLARPVAGTLADRWRRDRVAATGAALSAVSLAGYATASGFVSALLAAVVGGVGGALFWVALRAGVAERAPADPGAFARLFAAEGTGTWIAFVVALTLLPRIEAPGVFWGGALACAAAAVVLLAPGAGPAAGSVTHPAAAPWGQATRRLRPLLLTVAVTATAEGGIALVLLLHLQNAFALDVGEIALVFLPGFLVYSLAPEYLHGVVGRIGRYRAMPLVLAGSAVFAAALAWAPAVWVIAVAWVLAAASFAVAVPIEQAVVAETSGLGPGRAMAVYETATLAGVTVGTLGAGLLYDAGGLVTVCLAAAVLLVGTAALVPTALHRVGAVDRPHPVPPAGDPAPVSSAGDSAPVSSAGDSAPVSSAGDSGTTDAERPRWRGWAVHLTVYLVAQAGLALAGVSWPLEALTTGPHPAEWYWNSSGDLLLDVGRIWTAVILLDTLWTLGRPLLSRRSPRPAAPGRPGR